MSIKKQLRYVALNVSAFAGIGKKTKVKVEYPEKVDVSETLKNIEPNNGVVIVFPEGYPYVELEGNQGVGKTSLIECLKEAAGGIASSNTINQDVDEENLPVLDKKYTERFWGIDDRLYNLKVTKSTITLEEIETDVDGNPIKDKKGREVSSIKREPKTLLQKVIGPAGISPMSLKSMNGADQVKWVRSLYNLGLEEEKFEYDLKKKYDDTYKERTKANNEYDRLSKVLNANTYYKEYEKWQKYFETTKLEELQTTVQSVQKRKLDYDTAVNGLPQLKEQRKVVDEGVKFIEEEIKKLQEKLALKIADREKLDGRIILGEKYIEDNKSVVQEYEAMADKIREVTDYGAHQVNYNNMVELKKEMDHQSDEKIRLNNKVDELAKVKKDYVKKFSPDIPDFEILIADEGDKREGLFYKGKSLAILAESELWEFATQLWKALNVKIIYVENVSSLGSGAIEKFNEFLAGGGCYIFGTKMNRQEDNLKISFHTNIPV